MPEPVSAQRPRFSLDGNEQAGFGARLLELEIRHVRDQPGRCRFRLSNWGLGPDGAARLIDEDIDGVAFGRALEVRLAQGLGGGAIFSGRITALEGVFPRGRSPELLVEAEDALFELRTARRTRVFHQSAIPAVLQQVAGEHGLEGHITVQTSGVETELVQLEQTDLDFVLALAHRLDGWVRAEGRRLLVAPRGTNLGSTRTLRWSDELADFRARADLGLQRSRSTVTGWNPASKIPVQAVAGAEQAGFGETGTRTGAYYLAGTFGERPRRLPLSAVRRDGEATELARHQQREASRGFLVGEGELASPAPLQVGNGVSLAGLGKAFSGLHHVIAVDHHFSNTAGLVTRFTTERPFLGAPFRRRPGNAR
jgi:phage protein D